jgi:hypothetical protein
MTSFSLLKFKFTQIFLMVQNDPIRFSKTTEFYEKPVDNSIQPANNSVKSTEFRVSKIFPFLVQLNFISAGFFLFFAEFFKMQRIC